MTGRWLDAQTWASRPETHDRWRGFYLNVPIPPQPPRRDVINWSALERLWRSSDLPTPRVMCVGFDSRARVSTLPAPVEDGSQQKSLPGALLTQLPVRGSAELFGWAVYQDGGTIICHRWLSEPHVYHHGGMYVLGLDLSLDSGFRSQSFDVRQLPMLDGARVDPTLGAKVPEVDPMTTLPWSYSPYDPSARWPRYDEVSGGAYARQKPPEPTESEAAFLAHQREGLRATQRASQARPRVDLTPREIEAGEGR